MAPHKPLPISYALNWDVSGLNIVHRRYLLRKLVLTSSCSILTLEWFRRP